MMRKWFILLVLVTAGVSMEIDRPNFRQWTCYQHICKTIQEQITETENSIDKSTITLGQIRGRLMEWNEFLNESMPMVHQSQWVNIEKMIELLKPVTFLTEHFVGKLSFTLLKSQIKVLRLLVGGRPVRKSEKNYSEIIGFDITGCGQNDYNNSNYSPPLGILGCIN